MSYPVSAKFLRESFQLAIEKDFQCDAYGLVDTTVPKSLTYVDHNKYIQKANDNINILAVITRQQYFDDFEEGKIIIVVDDPAFIYWSMVNILAKKFYKTWGSIISPSAIVHSTSYISMKNVIIGDNTTIEANVTINADSEIGDNCIIRSGSVIGVEGFEKKRVNSGIISVFHDGKVVVDSDVEIGSLNSIAKGLMNNNTIIGSGTKTDSLVHIAHCVNIGRRCLITACSEISGSVIIEDDCWLGPNSSIINGIVLGKGSFVGIGAVVTRGVAPGKKVAGNPAKCLN